MKDEKNSGNFRPDPIDPHGTTPVPEDIGSPHPTTPKPTDPGYVDPSPGEIGEGEMKPVYTAPEDSKPNQSQQGSSGQSGTSESAGVGNAGESDMPVFFAQNNPDNLAFWQAMNRIGEDLQNNPDKQAQLQQDPVGFLEGYGLGNVTIVNDKGDEVSIGEYLSDLTPEQRSQIAEFYNQYGSQLTGGEGIPGIITQSSASLVAVIFIAAMLLFDVNLVIHANLVIETNGMDLTLGGAIKDMEMPFDPYDPDYDRDNPLQYYYHHNDWDGGYSVPDGGWEYSDGSSGSKVWTDEEDEVDYLKENAEGTVIVDEETGMVFEVFEEEDYGEGGMSTDDGREAPAGRPVGPDGTGGGGSGVVGNGPGIGGNYISGQGGNYIDVSGTGGANHPYPGGTGTHPAGTGTAPYGTGMDPHGSGTDPYGTGTDPYGSGTDVRGSGDSRISGTVHGAGYINMAGDVRGAGDISIGGSVRGSGYINMAGDVRGAGDIGIGGTIRGAGYINMAGDVRGAGDIPTFDELRGSGITDPIGPDRIPGQGGIKDPLPTWPNQQPDTGGMQTGGMQTGDMQSAHPQGGDDNRNSAVPPYGPGAGANLDSGYVRPRPGDGYEYQEPADNNDRNKGGGAGIIHNKGCLISTIVAGVLAIIGVIVAIILITSNANKPGDTNPTSIASTIATEETKPTESVPTEAEVTRPTPTEPQTPMATQAPVITPQQKATQAPVITPQQTEAPAVPQQTEHVHNWVVINSDSPSCERDGYELRECTDCGEQEYITIPAPGHDWVEEQQTIDTGTGVDVITVKRCTRCGATQ